MKIKIILCAVMLLLCNFAYGQPVTKENYEKAVDYLNCKTIELSLKINADEKTSEGDISPVKVTNYKDYQNKFPCDRGVQSKEIIEYLTGIGYEITTNLSKEIDIIKNLHKTDFQSDNTVAILSDVIFKDVRYPKLVDFANKRQNNPDFASFKEDLKNKLPTLLRAEQSTEQSTNVDSNTGPITNLNENIKTNANKDENKKDDNQLSFTTIVFFIAILLLLTGLVVSFKYLKDAIKSSNQRLQKKLYEHIDRKLKSNQETSARPSSQPNSDETNKLKKAIADLREALAVTNDRLETFIAENKEKPSSAGTFQTRQEQTHNPEPRREIFYFNAPNEDGTFNGKNVHSSYKNDASIYKFTKISSGEAEFQINDSESSFKLALEYPDKCIDPVCEAQNAFNPKASRIVTNKSGKASLEGDKWKVTKKALITYEY